MAVIPVIPTFAAGEELTAEKLNQLAAALTFQREGIRAKVARKLTTQTIASGVEVIFDSVIRDNDNMVNLVANATRITINTTGYYRMTVSFPWTDDGVGHFRSFRILKNGSEILGDVRGKLNAADQGAMSMGGSYYLVATDYLEIEIVHNATTFVTRTANDGPTLEIEWTGKPA